MGKGVHIVSELSKKFGEWDFIALELVSDLRGIVTSQQQYFIN